MADLIKTPVFKALTQPQMFAGVTYSYFIINAVVTTEVFLMTRSFWAFAATAVIHVVGYLMCLREPRVFDIWLTSVRRCPRVRNYAKWRCNSYHP